MSNKISISQVLFFFTVAILILSVVMMTTVNTYVQERSVKSLAINDANQHAELVFESLYTVMKSGWSKEEIDEIIERFNKKMPTMKLRLVRSHGVAELYGDTPVAKSAREIDPLIRSTFESKKEVIEEIGDELRFIYPVKAQEECLACHSNAVVGDVNGIIEVTFPYEAIAVPLEYAVNSIMFIFAAIFCVLFFVMLVGIRHFMVAPIVSLSHYMKELQLSKVPDLDENAGRSRIHEIDYLRTNFVNLMGHLNKAHQKLEDLTTKDPLTGLSNRRHFDEVLAQEIERANRYKHVFSIVMVDLDKFKPINDTYGHEAGDMVLKAVAITLTTHLRVTDVVARVGGDEFQIIAPEIDETQVKALAEKVREAIASVHVDFEGQSLSVACSVGPATYGVDATEPGDLHRIADHRMYDDKRARKQSRE